jgi:inner membrane protease ATP23
VGSHDAAFLVRSGCFQRVIPGPAVVFMLKRLEQSGCSVAPKHLSCQPCNYDRSGGFVPDAGITILCQGRFWSKTHMEHTLVHELVHMYDQCVFKVDWNNLRHHACSEVGVIGIAPVFSWRLTRDSNQRPMMPFRSGPTVLAGIVNGLGNCAEGSFHSQSNIRCARLSFFFHPAPNQVHFQACVRRRAVLSVAANPACPDTETAERAVNEVWDSCFPDTRPFDEVS